MIILKHKYRLFEDENPVQIYREELHNDDESQPELWAFTSPNGMIIVEMNKVRNWISDAIIEIRENWSMTCDVLSSFNLHYTDMVRSFATDGIDLWINPLYVWQLHEDPKIRRGGGKNDLFQDALMFLLLHETLHCIFLHTNRNMIPPECTDKFLLNVSMDAEINWYIENMLSVNGQFPFKGMSKKIKGVMLNPNIPMEKEMEGNGFEKIYPVSSDLEFTKKWMKNSRKKAKTSKEFKKGFVDGYNKVLSELRSQKLIERVVVWQR